MKLTKLKGLLHFLSSAVTARTIIISLHDYSGVWSAPYRKAGCRVLQIESKLGFDVFNWNYRVIRPELVAGILAAPPCTDFAVSGAQYWKKKDRKGQTRESLKLVRRTLEIVKYFKPDFWAMENPVGRLNTLLPELDKFGPWYFEPYWYGDPWSKKTGLWGNFKKPQPDKIVKPLRFSQQGSWTQLLGGKSERTKEMRSITPAGFANAFFKANPVNFI